MHGVIAVTQCCYSNGFLKATIPCGMFAFAASLSFITGPAPVKPPQKAVQLVEP